MTVGASVTVSIGSTKPASTGSRSRRRSRAAAGSPSPSSSRAARSCRGASVTSRPGRRSAMRPQERRHLQQRVVADAGHRRVAGRAARRDREAEDALLGDADAVDGVAVERDDGPGALVDDVVAADLVGVRLAEPDRALAAARLLVGRRDDDQLAARRPPALARERHGGRDLRRRLRLHVLRAAAPELAVGDLARPRVALPVGGLGEHGVDVREQDEPRPVGLAAQARDEVRALLGAAEQVDLEAGVAQDAGEVLLALALGAGRVHGPEPDEALEELRGVLLEIGHDPAGYGSAGGPIPTGGHTQRGDGPALRHRRAPAGAHRRPARAGPARGAHAPAHARRGRRPGARARRRAARCAPRSSRGARTRWSSTGRPGSGKTTIARIVATAARAAFEELSAVEAGRPEVRKVLERADHRRQGTGEPTIFFLDEIHRFNKAQQDALLPAVEEGLVTLIGATTENPYFEVNSALLSRTQVYELRALVGRRRRGAAAPRARPRRVRPARGARRRGRVPRRARRRRRADRPGGPRAGVRDRARRRAHHARARRGRAAAPRAHLRQAGRPPLRHDLGLDQVDARLGPGRVAVLPRGDDRVGRGPALHRPADGHPRLGGRGQRRPAGAAGRGRRGARRRARRACPRRRYALAQCAIYLSLAPKSNAAGLALGAARALVPRARRRAAPAVPAERRLPGRGERSGAARLRLPARQPGPGQRPGAAARRRSRARASTRRARPRPRCASASSGSAGRAGAEPPSAPGRARGRCQRDSTRDIARGGHGRTVRDRSAAPAGAAPRPPTPGRRAWARTSDSHGPRS